MAKNCCGGGIFTSLHRRRLFVFEKLSEALAAWHPKDCECREAAGGCRWSSRTAVLKNGKSERVAGAGIEPASGAYGAPRKSRKAPDSLPSRDENYKLI